MKRIISLILVFVIAFSTVSAFASPIEYGQAGILIDKKTGNILWEKNSTKKMYPASTTKIMTAMVILDAVDTGEITLEDTLTYTYELQERLDLDGTHIELKVGEEMTVLRLLEGLLVASGNDCAMLLSTIFSGNEAEFIKRMNDKAAALGLTGTHFTNPSGLPDKNHYTTARDLAKLAYHAMKNKTFAKIVGMPELYMDPTNKTEKQRYFINTNNLMSYKRFSQYYYPKATGIKTGYTDDAGACLVASAKDGDRELIAVILKAGHSGESHIDAKNLLEYGFKNYSSVKIASEGEVFDEIALRYASDGTDHVMAVAESHFYGLLPNGVNASKVEKTVSFDKEYVRAPIKAGDKVGSVTFTYNGNVLGKVNLVSDSTVKGKFYRHILIARDYIWSFLIVKIIVYGVIIWFVLYLIYFAYALSQAIKRKKRRQRERQRRRMEE